jgi:hypothetical protein
MASFVDVATLGVGFQASCPMYPEAYLTYFGDVMTTVDARLGVGFPCRVL